MNDLATFHLADRAVEILEQFDASLTTYEVGDILDLHNALGYAADGALSSTVTPERRTALEALLPAVRKTIALFFKSLTDANIATQVAGVDYEHHADLLELCAQFGVFERCSASVVLPAFEASGLATGQLLQNKKLVSAYDADLRTQLLSDPRNAEHLVRKYLEDRRSGTTEIHLPSSLTSADTHALLDRYLDSDSANPNFVKLIASAPILKDIGLDAKLKLKAKRTHEDWTTRFFQENTGFKTGCEVSISSEQHEPVQVELDGLVAKFTYGLAWLDENLDFPTILNNFIYVFEFCNRHMQLTLPSYRAELGVFERFMTTTGKGAYLTGSSFTMKHQSSFLQIAMYGGFLGSKDIDLEAVIAWFFKDYLSEQFGAENFNFSASSKTATYLERVRHLFSEMESVAKQFALYVENGELDTELLEMGGDQVRYKELPSLLDGKYAYVNDDNQDVRNVQNLLFSDQTGLGYIKTGLSAATAAELLTSNDVAYTDFAEHQVRQIDYLIDLGVLENTGARVQIADADQFRVLKTLNSYEAVSYYHFSPESRASIDDMVAKGWLVRRASLLSSPEGSYFNYYLNNSEFSGGPALRNKYVHGSTANPNDEDEHRNAYVMALRLLIALMIKINDDFCLRNPETEPDDEAS